VNMKSLENEVIPFAPERQTVAGGRPVEIWLKDLESNMQATVRSKIADCLAPLRQTGRKDRKWINAFPLQFILTAGAIFWTNTIEEAIGPRSKGPKRELYELRKQQYKLLQLLTQMIGATDLTPIQRTKLVAFITIEVHARDVLDHLYHEKVFKIDEFLWQMQLRFYWNNDAPKTPENPEGEQCLVKQTNWEFQYCYEYLGCTERLVITPLTDRCYITLTTALYLKLGGNPQGPAGTGKTETVKDLSKALGIYIIIFNCSEGLEADSLGRMFSGLAQTGAWSCFDEFNRIVVEVLSVVAQQVQTILDAVRSPENEFVFEGDKLPIKKSCGIFLTMNPGYAGRSELPDNLKALVRPVAMMVPDSAMIARIKLYSEGFKNSDPLSEKVDTLYQLAVQQLSRQPHYDWGLRAIKSVLVTAGTIKRRMLAAWKPDPTKPADQNKGPEIDEEVVVLRACRDMNVPKLVAHDARLFARLLRDLFHGVEVPRIEYGSLQSALEAVLQESPEHYEVHPHIIHKTIQLFETKDIRHGVMLVGPTGGGKSVIWNTLMRAKAKLHEMGVEEYQNVVVEVVNPKAITNDEMFGAYISEEWHEGITSTLVRRAADDTTPDEKWILFDGPVDTLWIESMNSVLDDSKVLTLNNQARITFPQQVSFLFEVENLAEASPATVSRCGIVYVDDRELGWQPFVSSWLAGKEAKEETKAQVPVLRGLFQKHVEMALQFRRDNCKELIRTTNLNAVQSLCRLFDCVATKENGVDPADQDFYSAMIELWFFFSLMWSVGGTLEDSSRKQWEQLMRELEGSFPSKDTVFEYVVDPVKKGWVSWEDRLPQNFKAGAATPFHKLFVPTIDTVRFHFILSHLMRDAQHTLLMGNTGTGKTAIAQNFINSLPLDKWIALTINMSARTESRQVQSAIESRTAPRGKKFSPLGGKRLLVFVDDLNMPAHDLFHSQPPLELLRQWMTYGFWYNRKDCSQVQITGMQLLGAMGPPGGGRTEISTRMLNRFNIVTVPFPSERETKRIFKAMIEDKLNEFEEEIRLLTDGFTAATIEVFKKVLERFRPTPERSHYLFNMRDLSKVFQGIRLAQKETIDSKEGMIRLWVHECYRVFHDRLSVQEDRDEFKKIIKEQLNNSSSPISINPAKIFKQDQVPIFCDFLHEGPRAEYEEVTDLAQLKQVLTYKLEAYNDTGSVQLSLVLFVDAMQHLCRISRIIRRPRGNALLVGIGGSGRQSLTKLAAFTADFQLFQIEVTKNFQLKDFREAMRALYKQAGLDKQETVFLLSDTQIAGDPTKPASSDAFFEDVNNMLTSGEIPNLYPPEDLQRVLSLVKDDALKIGLTTTQDVLYQYFIDRVRDNLHIVLCMSPVSKTFRAKLRNFPGLVNCTTIDWFSEWPKDALAEVAESVLSQPGLAIDEHKKALAAMFVAAHQAATDEAKRMKFELQRHVYVTPTSFRELCDGYRALLIEKRETIDRAAQKLRNGRDILKTTSDDIAIMKKDLEIRNKEASRKQEECDELLVKVVADRMHADEQAKKVTSERSKILEEAKRAEEEAALAKAEMDKVMPELTAAQEAVQCLTAPLIAEVRGYATPPAPVKMVLSAVMLLLGSGQEWEEIKQRLMSPHFKDDLIEFKAPSIKDSVLKKVERAVAQPGFDRATVDRVSKAAGILCLWVRATVVYKQTDTRLGPIIKIAEEKLATVRKKQEDLAQAEEQLARVQKQVEELERKHKEALQASDTLKRECAELATKLDRADKLVNGLSGERERWLRDIAKYELDIANLIGDCVVASAFLAYAGPFTSEFRTRLVNSWKSKLRELKLPHSPEFNFVDFLSDQTIVREWTTAQGLPNDAFSIENGVLVTRGRRWPLVIDPQGQAKEWIKVMEKERLRSNKNVVSPGGDMLKVIENAIKYGQSVLLQDVGDQLDPSLGPVIDKAIIKKDGAFFIKLGDSPVIYNKDFRFFLSTKLANPHYPPEVSTKTTIVNFAVKEEGLKEQLLGLVVRQENADLEIQKDRLVLGMAEKKKKQVEMEDKILNLLETVRGSGKSLLDDEELVNTLQSSKSTADSIKVDIVTMEENNKKIEAARAEYRPSAHRAAILFFILMDLARIDSMYQYSLEAYLKRFKWSLSRLAAEKKTTDVAARVQLLNQIHTEAIYRFVYRGLFTKHKLLFSFQMCMKILLSEDPPKFSPAEYQFFLRGGTVIDKEMQPKNPCDWLDDQLWDNITELEKHENFHGIISSFDSVGKDWKKWFKSDEPERAALPGEWESKCNALQRMVILRCLRVDRVYPAATDFIRLNMGPVFVNPVTAQLSELVDEAGASSPLIFILSPGVDPTTQLRSLAQQKNRNLNIVALGRGRWGKADAAIEEARKSGSWVFLANCHLDIRNMYTLEKILEEMNSLGSQKKPHRDFRLWLSSNPQENFPISILQNSIKITTEPPRGVKANLQRLYEAKLKDEDFTSLPEPINKRYIRLLFALGFFHSVLLERRKFLGLGFNIPYDFNDGDFEVCQLLLNEYLKKSPQQVPWEAINYLIAEANYGGRITDSWDRRLVNVYVKSFFHEDVVVQDHYSLSKLPYYFIPDDGSRQAYLTYINALPSDDQEQPQVFGQHRNAEIASQVQNANTLLNTIIDLQPRTVGSGGGGSETSTLSNLAKDMLERGVPAKIGETNAPTEISEDNPLNTVLQHESERYMKILVTVRRSLTDLIKGLAGEVVMSQELDEIAAYLTGGRVPPAWLKGYPSLKPLGSWLRDLQLRIEQLARWRDGGIPPKTFWLSGFTFPTGFLTALKQVAAQAQSISIDKLVWQFEATSALTDVEVQASPAEGAYIRGLFLEGAGWDLDKRQLIEPEPMQLVCPMPIIHFKPVPADKKKKDKNVHYYQCPAYYYPVRTGERERPSYMLTVELDSGAQDPDVWIKRGTALLLSLSN